MYAFMFSLVFLSISCGLSSAERPTYNDKNICLLPITRGLCYARFERYAFNTTSGKCQMFIYGGCAGNKNNFDTLQECQKICGTAR